MALSEEKRKAYAMMDAAVEALQTAYHLPGDITSHYVVIIGSTRLMGPDELEDDEDDEALGMRDAINYYTKLGQPDYVTVGLAQSFQNLYQRGWVEDDD